MSKQEDYHFIIESKMRNLLKKVNITIVEAAERTEISREYFYKMLKPGKLTVEYLITFCEKCDIEVSNFLNISQDFDENVVAEKATLYGKNARIEALEKLIEEMQKTNKAQEKLIDLQQEEIKRLKQE